ncbi:MAG TPA: NosD domain-containing protein [Candidatus Binatia bacterium]|jgi:hypothetical protein|nr:NosD domain-containing protein [Candidatus Binatia bacterium]
MRLSTRVLFVLACAGVFTANPAAALVWGVPGDGSNTCTIVTPSCDTIAAAVAAASATDTVQIAAGTFTESNITVDKALTIAGAGRLATTVQSSAAGFIVQASNVDILDLTITGGTDGIRITPTGGPVSDIELLRVGLANQASRGLEVSGATVSDLRVTDSVLASNAGSGIRLSSTSLVDGLTVTGSTFTGYGQGIYQANDGNTSRLNALTVSGSTFTNNGMAIYAEEMTSSAIEDNTFTGNGRSVLLFKAYTGSGVDAGPIAIRRNTISGGANASLQLIDQTPNGLGGQIDVEDNDITQDVGLLVANWGIIDIRLLSAATHATISLNGNAVTLSGTFMPPANAAYGVAIRGNGPVTLQGNTLAGGNVGGSGTTPPTSGVYIRSTDTVANFAAVPSGATLTGTCNRIGGFENGISVYGLVGNTYGGLAAGVVVSFTDNVIAGNTVAGVVTGASPPTIDAEDNYWGCAAGPGNPGCDTVVGDVDASPVASDVPACVACSTNAECNDGLACNGVETCDLGNGVCLAGTPVVCNDGDVCTTDSCVDPLGTCSTSPAPNDTPCDDGITCSIPDTCQAGVCDGVPDANMNGVCDADDVGPLSLLRVTIKGPAGGGGNGKVVLKGTFPYAPPTDVINPDAAVTMRVEDALTADQQVVFGPGTCGAKGTKVLCRSVDRKSKALFKPDRRLLNTMQYKAKLGGLTFNEPFAGPVTLTLTYGPGTKRAGSIASCVTNGANDLKCK